MLAALSLYQPWATLVAIGMKRIETRSWAPSQRGWLAIHATRRFDRSDRALCSREPFASVLRAAGYASDAGLPTGAIVAVANLHRVGRIGRRSDGAVTLAGFDLPIVGDELAFGDYTPGRYGLVLSNVYRLADPVVCRGWQGIWQVSGGVEREIARRLGPTWTFPTGTGGG